MSGHLHAIGLVPRDSGDYERLVVSVLKLGQKQRRPDGSERNIWTDPSGARQVAEVDSQRRIACAKPSFQGVVRQTADVLSYRPGRDCNFCGTIRVAILNRHREVVTELVIEHEDMARFREHPTGRAELSLTAFAERIDSFASEAAFYAAQRAEPRFATESLLALPGEQARAWVNGKVLSSEARTNSVSGRRFQHAVVATCGIDLDVVCPSGTDLTPGRFVSGAFWMIARDPITPEQY